jgi:hypothetical protein
MIIFSQNNATEWKPGRKSDMQEPGLPAKAL